MDVVGYGPMIDRDEDDKSLHIKAASLSVNPIASCSTLFDWETQKTAGQKKWRALKKFLPQGFADSMICASNSFR